MSVDFRRAIYSYPFLLVAILLFMSSSQTLMAQVDKKIKIDIEKVLVSKSLPASSGMDKAPKGLVPYRITLMSTIPSYLKGRKFTIATSSKYLHIDDGNLDGSFKKEVTLKKGISRVELIPMTPSVRHIYISFLGKKILKQRVSVRGTHCLFVLDRSFDFKSMEKVCKDSYQYNRSLLLVSEFPKNHEYLSSVDNIFISEEELSKLSTSQKKALDRWNNLGGDLLIKTAVSSGLLMKQFPVYWGTAYYFKEYSDFNGNKHRKKLVNESFTDTIGKNIYEKIKDSNQDQIEVLELLKSRMVKIYSIVTTFLIGLILYRRRSLRFYLFSALFSLVICALIFTCDFFEVFQNIRIYENNVLLFEKKNSRAVGYSFVNIGRGFSKKIGKVKGGITESNYKKFNRSSRFNKNQNTNNSLLENRLLSVESSSNADFINLLGLVNTKLKEPVVIKNQDENSFRVFLNSPYRAKFLIFFHENNTWYAENLLPGKVTSLRRVKNLHAIKREGDVLPLHRKDGTYYLVLESNLTFLSTGSHNFKSLTTVIGEI